jgi:putative tricarboxylic transport membrane protein
VNVPGDPPNAATTLDGYPMARSGRAPEALGAATLGSVIGAVVGTALLIALVPVAREFVLAFSYPEFFMIAFSGLVLIAVLTRASRLKGLVSGGVGLTVAFIGLDPVNGAPRFTFDQLYLWDGIDIVPALVGLFAGAEMLALWTTGTPVAVAGTADQVYRLRDGFVATLRSWRIVATSSVLGFVVGVIPGVGGTVASFVAYGQAAKTTRNPEPFGTGNVDGVIASETANDADKGGALLPTIAFGIPGGTTMAVLLAALILHGIPVGPNLLRDDNAILYVLIVAALVPRLVAAVIVLVFARSAVAVTRVPGTLLAPIVTALAIFGVYSLRGEMLDVVVAIVFSYVGYAMVRYGFSRVALIIALVLGGMLELTFHQTLETFGAAGFFTRPLAVALVLFSVLVVVGPSLATLLRRATGTADASGAGS